MAGAGVGAAVVGAGAAVVGGGAAVVGPAVPPQALGAAIIIQFNGNCLESIIDNCMKTVK